MKQKVKKGKSFKKGDQCVQNPSTKRFRDQVKRNVISHRKTSGGLTLASLEKHNDMVEEELDIGELAISEKTGVSNKSRALSISGLTDCSNITFNKVLDKWNSSDALEREKCAILAAVTEVIRSKGGSETESEYFAALMTVLEASSDEVSATAITYLLSLVIKKIPSAMLKIKFAETSKCLVELLEKYYENGKTSLVLNLIECLTATLAAEEPAVWTESSTQRCFQIILTFATHSKPRIRKLAHVSIKSLLKINLVNHKNHPVGSATTKFAVRKLEQHTSETSISTNHVLNLLKHSLQYFGPENLKELCETILRLLTINNPILKTNSMQTLHSLFTSFPPEENLSSELNAKLISAFYDFQPSVNDVRVADGWLSLMLAAHNNLSILDGQLCLKILPKIFGTAMTFFTSDHRAVAASAADIMKQTSEKCLESMNEFLDEDINSKDSSFCKIFKIVESGLRFKYQLVWDIVLQSMEYLYLTFGKQCASVMLKSVSNLIDMHESADFPFLTNLNKAVGAAVKAIGPKAILDERPLNLLRDDDVCEFPRAWLLPVFKENVQKTELQYFISHFLPIAAQLRGKGVKCRELNQDLEAKVYETLQSQIWAILPGFCTNPVDLKDSFKNIAKILGTAMTERNDLRPIVLQTLRTLIIDTQDEEELKVIGYYSKNYLPILFNLYTSDDEDCQSISLSILETIKTFLIVTEEGLISVFIKRILEKLKEEENKVKKRHQLMDLSVCMVKYSDDALVKELYKLAAQHVQGKDKGMQKKSYRILEEICDSNSENCRALLSENIDELKTMLVDSLSTAVPSSKAPRLRCISSIVKKLDDDHKEFLQFILPEVILCTKEVGVKAKGAAFDLLVEIGTSFVYLSKLSKEDCIEKYFQVVMAGLAASPHMISATLLAFTKLVFEYRYCISNKLVATLLESAINLLRSKTREVIKSSLLFIRAVVKILDANELSGHLETMIKNLFAWNTSSKSAYRQQIRVILERLDKKCGYQLIRSLVPQEHKKFIIQIHKTLERTKRQKEARRNAALKEDGTEKLEKQDNKWEDILADSDVDEEKEDNKYIQKKKDSSKHTKTWIVEGDDTVDLLDPKIARSIVATKPKGRQKHSRATDDFTLSNDGKLIIKEEEEEDNVKSNENAFDVGVKDLLEGFEKTPKQIKLGKRKHLEEMPEDENSQYQPGGAGIHRNRDEDLPKRKRFGQEYKAKKAGGDMKLKGKPDPFAYIPLNRQKLNKRKKAKHAGQFQGMVKAARKGAAKGNKGRKQRK